MRITHQMLNRNYLSRMQTNYSGVTSSNDRLASGRKFNKSHENVADAGKALRTRKLIANNERYQTAIRDAQGRADAAEDSLRNVSELMIKAKERIVEGLNGTMTEEDRKILANEMGRYQEEIFQVMNSTFNDKYLFSASGSGKRDTPPFSVDANGKLLYNGTEVDSMTTGAGGVILDSSNNPIPYNTHNYVDIGFGYDVNTGSGVNSNTAFKDTYSGVESYGFGTDANGVPVNAWSLFGDIVNNLNTNNLTNLKADLETLPLAQEYILKQVTEIGARGVLLDDTKARLENEYVNLTSNQDELEYVDVAEEMMYNKSYEMSWMVTLQLGGKIIPPSIFDFLR